MRMKTTGIGLILFLILLFLKLTGLIAISWWWVTSPLWIPIVLFTIFFTAGIIFLHDYFKA